MVLVGFSLPAPSESHLSVSGRITVPLKTKKIHPVSPNTCGKTTMMEYSTELVGPNTFTALPCRMGIMNNSSTKSSEKLSDFGAFSRFSIMYFKI